MDGGHAGTGLSIAEGLALARDRRGGTEHIAVVVGDAALMSGLSLEALNDIGQRKTRMVILLNDNEMSISPTVGAVSQYLSRIKLSPQWRDSRRTLGRPGRRHPARRAASCSSGRKRVRHAVVDLSQPGRLFEDLGVTYVGPVPGHDLVALDRTLRAALLEEDAPIIVHVRTRKGFGYHPAEADKVSFHGAALPPMPGQQRSAADGGVTSRSAPVAGGAAPAPVSPSSPQRGAADGSSGDGVTSTDGDAAPSAGERASAARQVPNYTAVMAAELLRIADEDERVVAITAGMPTGTGVATFGARYPERVFDVGIAEQHAMTMAAGLAIAGQRPFVALYSTFLQRAFDQVVHDVCQNDVPVVIGIDRAGLVGEDGTSHQGMFTLSALRQLPNLVMAAPRDEQELRRLLRTAFAQEHPFAIQYPRDAGFDLPAVEPLPVPVGSGELLREGTDIVIVGLGPIVARGLAVAEALGEEGWSVGCRRCPLRRPARPRPHPGPGGRPATAGDAGGERPAGWLRLSGARAARGRRGWRRRRDVAGHSPHRHPGRSFRGARLGGRPASRPAPGRGGHPRPGGGGHRVARPHADRAALDHPGPGRHGGLRRWARRGRAGSASTSCSSSADLAETRSRAQALLLAGRVRVGIGDGARRDLRAGDLVAPDVIIELDVGPRYVSRGGEKLAGALDAFGVDPGGRVCLDVGASTGGFTDCLLQRGARRVYALDVGRGQLAESLRADGRVVSMERTHAARLDPRRGGPAGHAGAGGAGRG